MCGACARNARAAAKRSDGVFSTSRRLASIPACVFAATPVSAAPVYADTPCRPVAALLGRPRDCGRLLKYVACMLEETTVLLEDETAGANGGLKLRYVTAIPPFFLFCLSATPSPLVKLDGEAHARAFRAEAQVPQSLHASNRSATAEQVLGAPKPARLTPRRYSSHG